MPYTSTILGGQTADALALEMKGLLDTALINSGKYTKVTTAYVSGTRTYDVWKNDGTTDGYEWYLMVMTDTLAAQAGRLFIGGSLGYTDATKQATSPLRGYLNVGTVDAAGYPTTNFPLGSFTCTTTNSVGTMSPLGTPPPTAAVNNVFRVLVTGQVAWIWWGTTATSTYCGGVGTYQNLHTQYLTNKAMDAKPLAFLAHTGIGVGGSVWQHPLATDTNPRSTYSNVLSGSVTTESWTRPIGQVGSATGLDLNYGTSVVGSRLHVMRSTSSSGGGAPSTQGYSLGLAPADFLLFGRQASVQIGDTVTVKDKIYASVTVPSTGPGLFVNTQPAV